MSRWRASWRCCSNRRWRGQFRCRGSRRESAVAQLSTLLAKHTELTRDDIMACAAFTADQPFGSYIPVKSIRVRIMNEESREIQVAGMSPAVYLKPGESYEFTVEAGPASKGVDGVYICGFNMAVRVKLTISGEHLDDTTINITGLGAYGM